MTVNDIFEFLNGIAPVNTAAILIAGILVGDPSAEVSWARLWRLTAPRPL